MQIECQRKPRIAGWRQIAFVVDDQEVSLRTLQSAVAAARHHRARLTLVSVAARPWATVALTGMCPRRLEAEATEFAAAKVRRLAATVPADVPCTTVVRCGRVVKEILGVLGERDYDLVFFALRQYGALGGGLRLLEVLRLMRRTATDCVFLSPGSLASAGTSASLFAAEDSFEVGVRSWPPSTSAGQLEPLAVNR